MNFLKLPEPRLTVEHHGDGTMTCLPTGLDRSNLINVSTVGGGLGRDYLDTVTGEVHRSAAYYNQMKAELAALKQN